MTYNGKGVGYPFLSCERQGTMADKVQAIRERLASFEQVQKDHREKRSFHDRAQREAGVEVAKLKDELISALAEATTNGASEQGKAKSK